MTDRRRLLKLGLAGACALAPRTLLAAPPPARPRPARTLADRTLADRTLAYLNLHTGEKVTATFWADGAYLADGLADMDQVLRDFRTGEVMSMDRRLYDLLHALRGRLETDAPFHVISGYRSPKTNAALAQAGGGVAKRSLHMRGMAIDIRLPGHSLKALHRAARSLRAGGVGLYPRSNFVHVDVGRVRYW